jgi:hypothetical protein
MNCYRQALPIAETLQVKTFLMEEVRIGRLSPQRGGLGVPPGLAP